MTRDLGHPELTSLHLLMAALQQEGGLALPLATEILSGKLRPGSKVVADLGQDSDGEPRVTLRPAA